ncbi:prepilin signalpeptidase, partial [Clavibacter michiganensis subsp. michiganensis]|nr:prepilin signalpeptidase [Clavibacter michiganensis subsp. michiganensis]
MIPAVAPALSVAAGLAGAAVGAWSPALARVALAGGRRP